MLKEGRVQKIQVLLKIRSDEKDQIRLENCNKNQGQAERQMYTTSE